jgi:hypothetical protein
MRKGWLQQEILLLINTSYTKNQLKEKGSLKAKGFKPTTKEIELACWGGLLCEMLPEIVEKSKSGKQLNLSHIFNGESFLQIELSEFPLPTKEQPSIHNNIFRPCLFFN